MVHCSGFRVEQPQTAPKGIRGKIACATENGKATPMQELRLGIASRSGQVGETGAQRSGGLAVVAARRAIRRDSVE